MKSIAELKAIAADNLDGQNWYTLAQSEIRVICQLENWRVEQFTGILSVTSPRCSVRRNVRIALQYCGTGRILNNVMRSVRRSIEIFNDSGEIRGPKTSTFNRALLGDASAVVLDSHMANLFEVRQSIAFRRKGDIKHWSKIVADIAAEIDLTPSACQACLWYGQRRSIGEYPENFPIAAEYKNWLAHNREFPASGQISFDFDDSLDSTPF